MVQDPVQNFSLYRSLAQASRECPAQVMRTVAGTVGADVRSNVWRTLAGGCDRWMPQIDAISRGPLVSEYCREMFLQCGP